MPVALRQGVNYLGKRFDVGGELPESTLITKRLRSDAVAAEGSLESGSFGHFGQLTISLATMRQLPTRAQVNKSYQMLHIVTSGSYLYP